MRVLVLGGTRYFGKRLVDLLTGDGHDVTVASTGKTASVFKRSVERIKVDRKDAQSIRDALGGRHWDIVYDQVCFDAASATSAVEIFAGKVGRLVFTSSQSVYSYGANIDESAFVAETYSGDPSNENPYQEGKRLAERVYATQTLIPVTMVRFPIVLGYDDPTGRLHWHVARVKYGDPIFFPDINARLSFILSEEAGSFLARVKDSDLYGAVNVGSSEPIQLRWLMNIVEHNIGKKLTTPSAVTEENHSPFGVGEDWIMSVRLAAAAGFCFGDAKKWIAEMVGELSGRVTEANRAWSHPKTLRLE